jgi:hypothetical protein
MLKIVFLLFSLYENLLVFIEIESIEAEFLHFKVNDYGEIFDKQ